MSVPLKEIVQPLIDKYREPIVTAILGAWDDWMESPYSGIWRYNRSRANFVWEQIIGRALPAFDGLSGVHIIEGHATCKFLLEDRVLFRFKKGNHVGLSTNIPTQLSLAFNDHEQDLFGLPDVHRVEVVYQLNWLQTKISNVLVVGRDNNEVIWTYSLLNASDSLMPLPPMPEPSGEPPVNTARDLVRQRDASEARKHKKKN